MTARQEIRELSNEFQNDTFSLGASETITFHTSSGSDTATDRYLGLSKEASFGIEIIPTVACSITKINGKTLKSSISVGTGGIRMSTGIFNSVTLQAGSATVIEILGKC